MKKIPSIEKLCRSRKSHKSGEGRNGGKLKKITGDEISNFL